MFPSFHSLEFVVGEFFMVVAVHFKLPVPCCFLK